MPAQYALHLKGFVGGADFDRNYVDYVLDKFSDKPVRVLIDSLGGSVPTALSIASAFRLHADVSVHFVGMNASAATIASLGAKHISMDKNAMYLVHKCSSAFFEWGSLNADQFASLIADCEKIKADLDKLDLNIASMYSDKCKKNPKDLLDLMKIGGWLSADEALEWGFVDEVTDLDESAPELTDAMASELAAAGIPIPNVPLADKESTFAKFLSSLASIFKSTKPISNMPKDPITVQPQEADRIADLEAKVSSLVAERDALAAELDALKQKPGDNSTHVVDERRSSNSMSPLEQYCSDLEEARAIFNALP